MSENIRVTSIVGRYLEHVRAFRFENGGQSETYLSSADWMPRNLDRRVELMFPVRDAAAKRGVDSVLALQCADNQKRWRLLSDGSYVHIDADGHTPVNAQETLLARLAAVLAGEAAGGPRSPKKLHGKADRP
jgi:polyphosphate kinase